MGFEEVRRRRMLERHGRGTVIVKFAIQKRADLLVRQHSGHAVMDHADEVRGLRGEHRETRAAFTLLPDAGQKLPTVIRSRETQRGSLASRTLGPFVECNGRNDTPALTEASRHIAVSSLSSREVTRVRDTGPFAPRNFRRKPQLISRMSPSGRITGAESVGRMIFVSRMERSFSTTWIFTLVAFYPIALALQKRMRTVKIPLRIAISIANEKMFAKQSNALYSNACKGHNSPI